VRSRRKAREFLDSLYRVESRRLPLRTGRKGQRGGGGLESIRDEGGEGEEDG
jgi:hypothetical protein